MQAYQKAHPDVKIKIVTYSGDANGANDLQTKVQLFDRSGSGWPDVAFSANVNDGSWTTQGKTPFAAPVDKGLIPQSTLNGFADGAHAPIVRSHAHSALTSTRTLLSHAPLRA